MKPEEKRHAVIAVAVVGGGIVLVLFLRGSTATAPAGGHTSAGRLGENFTPNPQNANIEEAILGARESALNTYDQSAVAEKSLLEQYMLGINEDITQRAIAFNTNATQLKETGLTTTAEQSIAEEEAQAQEQAAAQQAQAYESAASSQSQGSFFGGLGGLLGGLGSIFGF